VDKDKAQRIYKILEKTYPHARIALDYKTPIDLLVATILSAQCTDKRVNLVTKDLFKRYKTPKDYAKADPKVFGQEIRSTGFYNSKSNNIINAAKAIVKDFKGKVPDDMESLLQLSGVARKTATVVLYNTFHKIEGITCDTHVIRLSQRLGLSRQKNPKKIEQDLMELFPKKDWGKLSDLLIDHGRSLCLARNPQCGACPIKKLCPSANN